MASVRDLGTTPPVSRKISTISASIRITVLMSIWKRCRSEEHTSELQSLMRISYAVFCLKKKKKKKHKNNQQEAQTTNYIETIHDRYRDHTSQKIKHAN